jgi:hypothetical protein
VTDFRALPGPLSPWYCYRRPLHGDDRQHGTKLTFEIPLLPTYHMVDRQGELQQLDRNHIDDVRSVD